MNRVLERAGGRRREKKHCQGQRQATQVQNLCFQKQDIHLGYRLRVLAEQSCPCSQRQITEGAEAVRLTLSWFAVLPGSSHTLTPLCAPAQL